MTEAQTGMLVVEDAAGSYFLVPQEALEQWRVPAEHQAEVGQLLAEADGDVQGYETRPPPQFQVRMIALDVNNDGTTAGMGRYAAAVGTFLNDWFHKPQ